MKDLLSDWHSLFAVAGLAVLAILGIFFWLWRKPEDSGELERERRAYLNRVGRIVEGQVLEIAEHPRDPKESRSTGLFGKRRPGGAPNGAQKLIHYTYSISGVTYETAQDITGLEERLVLTRAAAGQTASVKYDPSNPSNSILVANDWSGLH